MKVVQQQINACPAGDILFKPFPQFMSKGNSKKSLKSVYICQSYYKTLRILIWWIA